MSTFIYALTTTAKELLGFSLASVVAAGQNKKDNCWALDSDLKEFHHYLIQTFLSSWPGFKSYLKLYNRLKAGLISTAKKIHSLDLQNITQHKIALIYHQFEEANKKFMFIGQFVGYEFSAIAPDFLKDKLISAKIKPNDIERILSLVCTPFEQRLIARMEEDIVRLALKIKTTKLDDRKFYAAVARLTETYGWLTSMTINTPLWDEKFFKLSIKELGTASHIREKINILKQNKRDKYRKKQAYKKLLSVYPHFKAYFQIVNFISVLKDERDEARRYVYFLVRPLFNTIAKAAQISIDELLLVSADEIVDFLERKEPLPSHQELMARRKNYIIRKIGGRLVIYSGRQAAAFSKKYLREQIFFAAARQTITGTSVSPGRIKGRVRLVHDKSDLPQVKRGEIMVAVTTHPDYLPAMKRAAAIVTDEGGLTCHAAIVSRELKIPCIVGTKIATALLHDGDLIEVDASHGIVKIINTK